jgi:hypothetical protein
LRLTKTRTSGGLVGHTARLRPYAVYLRSIVLHDPLPGKSALRPSARSNKDFRRRILRKDCLWHLRKSAPVLHAGFGIVDLIQKSDVLVERLESN